MFNILSLIGTSILGSLMYFKEIKEEELKNNFDLEPNIILLMQDFIVKMISKRYFGEELTFERLIQSNDKTKNFCIIDLFTHFFKNKQLQRFNNEKNNEILQLKLDKLANLIGKLITERDDGII